MITALHAVLLIPAIAVVVLVFVPNYRVGAALNMLAAGLTFMAGASLLFDPHYRTDLHSYRVLL